MKLEVFVDKKSAFKLNSGVDKLYDILVLHLEGGKDIFITVTGMYKINLQFTIKLHILLFSTKGIFFFSLGNYERSCFGSSLEALVHVSVPVREIPIGKLVELVSMLLQLILPYSLSVNAFQTFFFFAFNFYRRLQRKLLEEWSLTLFQKKFGS